MDYLNSFKLEHLYMYMFYMYMYVQYTTQYNETSSSLIYHELFLNQQYWCFSHYMYDHSHCQGMYII